jgi:uncharacterized protein
MVGLIESLSAVTSTTWTVFVQFAPFLFIGLILAGWLKILILPESVHKYLGRKSLKSAFTAALFGLPMPICSCGVVPLSLSLREKGAGRESNLAFLISTPETSVDTVAVTWGMLGPLMAIVRPITSLLTAMFAAVVSMIVKEDPEPTSEVLMGDSCGCSDGCCSTAKKPADSGHDHDHGETVDCGLDDCDALHEEGYHVVGFSGVWASMRGKTGAVPMGTLVRDANRYAFREMLDDISLWLVIGLILAGAIGALMPESWMENVPGGQFGGMVAMLLVGIPMYVCSVEATPIAAILIAKGLSAGAALVFMMAGPATNIATLVLISQAFGRRFTRIYLGSIIIVSFAAGLALNALLRATGWEVTATIVDHSEAGWWGTASLVSAVGLVVLLAASFARLNWRAKWQSFKSVGQRFATFFRVLFSSLGLG